MLNFRDLSSPGKKPFKAGTTFEDVMAAVELDPKQQAQSPGFALIRGGRP